MASNQQQDNNIFQSINSNLKNLCKCGCGELCQKTYIHGHNQKNKKLSEEHIDKIIKSKENLKFDRIICQYCNKDVASNKIKRHEINCKKKDHSIHYCQCGCKEICNENKEFIHGHNRKNEKQSEEQRKKIAIANKGHITSDEQKKQISETLKRKYASGEIINSKKGTHLSEETKQLIKDNAKINLNYGFKGKHLSKEHIKKTRETRRKNGTDKHTEESKQKFREIRIKQILKNGSIWQQIGNNETKLLDEQEIKDNCKIDRNFQIIGYRPDGYCHETNTIYEVYEKAHNKYIFKDLERENRICNKLGCDFIIIYDRSH
jgi:very-short-patch-repair endonuclease